ncbi:MAG: thioredoxin family protein [Bacteroidetes bacterium]|nr:thioredoxin family protein [Bacteroidota bacterium]
MKSIRHLLTCLALAGACLLLAAPAVAQKTDSTPPPFKRFPTVPPFELLGLDNQKINRESLAKRAGTLIIYFSPDCHHCQQQMDWLKEKLSSFDKYNLVLATYQPMEELQGFYDKYKMASWKNLYIGRDEKFFLPPYFKINNLPFLALYDKNGNLLTSFEGTTEIAKVLQGFK